MVNTYLLQSFGVDESGGNPAGVVLDADTMSEQEMQFVATAVGFSETAFVQKSDRADFKIRFFAPTEEVDICGHATIATFALLFQLGVVPSGMYTQETRAGLLSVEIFSDGFIFMEQLLPAYGEMINREIVEEVGLDFPVEDMVPQIVSTGLRDILLPVVDRKSLFEFMPQMSALARINKETHSIGLHAFTLDTIREDSIAHSRNFAPLYGIDEESATGSSTGALACYLFKNGKLNGKNLERMRFEQGYSMGKPSEIFVTLNTEGEHIQQVWVGGKATVIGNKKVEVPVL